MHLATGVCQPDGKDKICKVHVKLFKIQSEPVKSTVNTGCLSCFNACLQDPSSPECPPDFTKYHS